MSKSWTDEEVAAIERFCRGDTSALEIDRTDLAIKRKFPELFRGLALLRQEDAAVHEATRELFTRLRTAPLHKEGSAIEQLIRAVNRAFCLEADLPRGDDEAAAIRRKALEVRHGIAA
ncbi:hypothetical protein [Henriciella pelagia]|uniref:hypothetical protein n=1 Tax=Henriciella pelagia TaxID=1977912 RepID=UPI003518ECCD